MQDNNIDLQSAFDLAGKKYGHLVEQFQSAKLQMPSFGNEVDEMVAKYLEGLAYWVSGNLKYATPLYFLTS
jgi:alpha-muurolene/germacrene-A/gamma-muurolene synthase